MKRIQDFAPQGASRRGVAKVGIAWLISIVVLLIFALVFVFSGMGERTDLQTRLDNATKAQNDAVAAERATSVQISELSRVTGYYDPNAPIPVANLDAMKAALESAKQTFTDAGQSVTDFEKLLPVAQQSYLARTQEVRQLKDQVAALTTEKSTIEKALRDASAQKEAQLVTLQKQFDDAAEVASRTISGLEAQITASKSQASGLDAQLREARQAAEQEKHNLAMRTTEFDARINAMSRTIAFQKEPESADGSILAVSKGAKIGWIDIGSNQRVGAGMKFRLVSGKLGSNAVKAIAEVVSTEPNRSEVLFTEIADKFDPPVVGDKIFNPLLDPKGQRNAVLVGRFSVPSENEVRGLLANMGITVQPKLDNTTDYLIVGTEMYVDPEGNALEEPMQPSETAVYKDAEAQGVAITPIKDLRAYFKF